MEAVGVLSKKILTCEPPSPVKCPPLVYFEGYEVGPKAVHDPRLQVYGDGNNAGRVLIPQPAPGFFMRGDDPVGGVGVEAAPPEVHGAEADERGPPAAADEDAAPPPEVHGAEADERGPPAAADEDAAAPQEVHGAEGDERGPPAAAAEDAAPPPEVHAHAAEGDERGPPAAAAAAPHDVQVGDDEKY